MLKRLDEDEEKRPSTPEYYENILQKVQWYHWVLLNRPLKVALVMLVVVLVIPPVVFYFLYQSVYVGSYVDDGYSLGICSHAERHRVRCGAEEEGGERDCPRYCCYDLDMRFCYHTIPSRYSYISKNTWSEEEVLTPRVGLAPYPAAPPSTLQLKLHIDEKSPRHVTFTLYDPSKVTYPRAGRKQAEMGFTYKVYYPEVQVEVFSKDKAIEKPLLSTARGPLVSAQDFWEWSVLLSDEELYGAGEAYLQPKVLYGSGGDSHSYPLVLGHRGGSFHGLWVEQRGPLELNLTESKVLSLRSLGGEQLSLHFFYGPSPGEVLAEFREFTGGAVGVPYWALGVHYCRGNLTSSQSLEVPLRQFYAWSSQAVSSGLPYDSDCLADGVLPFLNHQRNASYLGDILQAKQSLTDKGIVFWPTLRPHIRATPSDPLFQSAVEAGVLFLNSSTNATYMGSYAGTPVAIPDYSAPSSAPWLQSVWPFKDIADSWVLTDNWPRMDIPAGTRCSLNHFYVTELINKTVCEEIPWSIVTPSERELMRDVHNKYGREHVRAVGDVVGEGGFMMTGSSWVGTRGGTLQQNVSAEWGAFKRGVNLAAWGGMQGNYLHSVPVCGTHGEGSSGGELETLCVKWYLASAFLPVVRVHSDVTARDPLAFSGFAANIMVSALRTRYKLLPYMAGYLMEGTPLLRPMFYEFWTNNKTYHLDEQFMVGSALLIAPGFQVSSPNVLVYVPEGETVYELWGGNEMPVRPSRWVEVPTLENEIVTLLRAGHIVPIQEEVQPTALATRQKSKVKLIVALKCNASSGGCEAEGSMWVKRGGRWWFRGDEESVEIRPWEELTPGEVCGGGGELPNTIIDTIRVYGIPQAGGKKRERYYEATNLNINLCDYPANAVIQHQYNGNNPWNAVIQHQYKGNNP